MYNFCTLFDSRYLSRGIALYRSLERVCGRDFHLYIFAFDEKSLAVLRRLNLSSATIISLNEFEDEALLRVRPTRSAAEYCWTATSSTIQYVLRHYSVESCTYLDADMMFFDSPRILFDELREDSIIITEHRYSPQYDKEAKSGKYCVQFVTFKNDERGRSALQWWRERCLEWCYNRFEDGKFGDQKYLDDWTTRFHGVHELQHLGGGMAAWNVQQYDVFEKNGKLFGKEKLTEKEFPVVFYHYHYVRLFTDGTVELGRIKLTEQVKTLLYVPYFYRLEEAKRECLSIDPSFDPHGSSEKSVTWKTPLLYLYRKVFGIYHIYPIKEFLH